MIHDLEVIKKKYLYDENDHRLVLNGDQIDSV
jgi:hypothetical protein